MGIDIIWKWKHTNAWALIPKAPLYPLHTLIEHITSVMATTWMQEENNEHHLWSHSWIFPALLSYFFLLQLSLYGFAVLETARFVFKTHSQPISFHTPSSHPLSVTALSLFSFFFAGTNPGYLWARAGYPGQVASSSQGPHWWQRPPCKVPAAHQEQFGVQYLAQGHFDMQLSPAWSWDLDPRPSNH